MTTSKIIRGGAKPSDLSVGQRLLFEMPWHAIVGLLRLMYGFRVEGSENLPSEGPFILVVNEHSPIAFLITGWISIVSLKEAFKRNPETISFLREELFDFPFFRSALTDKTPGRYAALTPVSAGRLALGLLEAYRVLQNKGIVVLNPEGDMPWDGRPLRLGHALAWLGLHTAAPIVPAIITMGAYDIWPRWQPRLNLSGRVRLRIGKPFQLAETPHERVSEEDMLESEKLLRACIDELCYENGGKAGWSGAPTRNGKALGEAPKVHVVPVAETPAGTKNHPVPLWRRGIGLLLWRCPVCHVQDSLVHVRPWFGVQSVYCQACHTRWRVHRVPGKDFRLEVTEGPAELVGLEMALCDWYDEIKKDLAPPEPVMGSPTEGARELSIAEAKEATLLPRLPNRLLDSWNGREPPQTQPPSQVQLSGWGKVGKGNLVLTDRRLVWEGPAGSLDFWWRNVTSVSLWMLNTMTVRYGSAQYRFELGQENGLKWLSYAAIQAQRAAAETGAKLNIGQF